MEGEGVTSLDSHRREPRESETQRRGRRVVCLHLLTCLRSGDPALMRVASRVGLGSQAAASAPGPILNRPLLPPTSAIHPTLSSALLSPYPSLSLS